VPPVGDVSKPQPPVGGVLILTSIFMLKSLPDFTPRGVIFLEVTRAPRGTI
jgi:hypothetical protein